MLSIPKLPLLGFVLAVFPGCSSDHQLPPESLRDDPYALPDAQILEAEPNDIEAQDLGVLSLPLVVGGSSDSCGEDGSFAGSDLDVFRFQPSSGEVFRIVLMAPEGDLDLELARMDGEVLAESVRSGNEEESIEVALSPARLYRTAIRCWMGEIPAWRLRFESLN